MYSGNARPGVKTPGLLTVSKQKQLNFNRMQLEIGGKKRIERLY